MRSLTVAPSITNRRETVIVSKRKQDQDAAADPRRRRVEVGLFRTANKNIHVYLRFETFPTWLPLLDAFSSTITIHVLNVSSKENLIQKLVSLSNTVTLLTWLLESWAVDRITFDRDDALSALTSAPEVLVLVSGSLEYVYQHSASFKHLATIGVVDTHFAGRLRKGRPSGSIPITLPHVKWFRLRHSAVGGPTDYIALFAVFGGPPDPTLSILRRTLGDIFNHGIRPTISQLTPPAESGDFYSVNSVIRQGSYLLPVHHPTEFYHTKWGVRQLTLGELSVAHGFPREQANLVAFQDLERPPLQLLSAFLLPTLKRMDDLLVAVVPAKPACVSNTLPELYITSGPAPRVVEGSRSSSDLGVPEVLGERPTEAIANRVDTDPSVLVKIAQPHFSCPGFDVLKVCEPPPEDTDIGVLPSEHPTESFLPQIGLFLSHDWLDDSLQTSTVAKNDAARAPSHLWDARLLLLYPQASLHHLTVLRQWLLGRFRRRLFLEFRAYLDSEYASNRCGWLERLRLGRQALTPRGGTGTRNRPRKFRMNEMEMELNEKELELEHIVTNINPQFVTNNNMFPPLSACTMVQTDPTLKQHHPLSLVSRDRSTTKASTSQGYQRTSLMVEKEKFKDYKKALLIGQPTNAAKAPLHLTSDLKQDRSKTSLDKRRVGGKTRAFHQSICIGGAELMNNINRDKLKYPNVSTDEEESDSIHTTDTADTVPTENNSTQQLIKDVLLGCDILFKHSNCSWWDWETGSSLVFWRWQGINKIIARDGMPPFIAGQLPHWKRASKVPSKDKFDLVLEKVSNIVARGYVVPGYVTSLTEFFDVPKGDDDIRLVYNGSSCGLNDALWAPNFWLPTPRSAIRLLDFSTYSVDLDLGEMFLNFPLHESIQEYSGIDLGPFKKELGLSPGESSWYRWARNWMGSKSSPYSSVRFYYLAEEFVRGNRTDRHNALRWDEVRLNLPGSPEYNPSKPRVRKWDKEAGGIAGDVITYVDDVRGSGTSVEHAWAISHQVGTRLQYMGIQDATRKRKSPSQNPGPWAGAIMLTSSTSIAKTVSEEKWKKGRKLVNNLWIQIDVAE